MTWEISGPDTWTFVDAGDALDWMVRAGIPEEELKGAFPDVEDERGPGRPQIGRPRKVTLSDEMWAALQEQAQRHGTTPSDLIRQAITTFLTD